MGAVDWAKNMPLAEEQFSAEDDGFVHTLRNFHDPKRLATFADRWKRDPRPWAREQKLRYLRMPPDCIGHQPVVKRLFKQAEEDGDDAVMAVCAALFDRLVRHVVRTRHRWDWQSRSSWEEEYLAWVGPELPCNPSREREGINPFTGEKVTFRAPPPPKNGVYFSLKTRYYLQRRAWRYFRRMGQLDPDRYVAAATLVLREYQAEDLERGELILDSWTLLQLAFREHPALEFGRERIRLADDGSLGQLRAAPRFSALWQDDAAFDSLMDLMHSAPSRLVRVWAMQMVEAFHRGRAAELPAETLLELLASDDQDIRDFAARLLKGCAGMADLPLETWLRLLDDAPAESLPAICEAMQTHVAPGRLSLAECVDLAIRQPTPIAQLGFEWLRTRTIGTEEDLDQVARLADAECAAIADELADWALSFVGSRGEYDRDHVSRFFDSLSPAIRRRAWEWLDRPDCPGADDPVLFCRLLETPFDDLKLRVVDLLERRNLPGEARAGLVPVWTAVLLGVHRGGRQKLKATRQLADRLVAEPAQADELLPVLAAAVRSVRAPEARAGLAAAVASLAREPELEPALARYLPELQVLPAEAPA